MRNKSCMPGMGRRATTESNRRQPGQTIMDPSLSRWAVKLGKGPSIYIPQTHWENPLSWTLDQNSESILGRFHRVRSQLDGSGSQDFTMHGVL